MKQSEILLCEHCGKPFEKKTSNQRFCCLGCRMEFYRNQVKEEEGEYESIDPSNMKLKEIIEILSIYNITFEEYETNKKVWIRKYQARKKYIEG